MLAERVRERHFEVRFIERLTDEVRRAELHRLDHGRGTPLAGEHDDRDFVIDFLKGGQGGEPVHFARHHHVQNHRGGAVGPDTARPRPARCSAPGRDSRVRRENDSRKAHIAGSSSTTMTFGLPLR